MFRVKKDALAARKRLETNKTYIKIVWERKIDNSQYGKSNDCFINKN